MDELIFLCPDCGADLEVMVEVEASESKSGYTEQWCNCPQCTQDWEIYYDEVAEKMVFQRHSWG